MRVQQLLRIAAVLAGATAMNGCWLLVPCEPLSSSESLRGTWSIQTVNGQPIPSGGLPIPNSSDRLVGGSLTYASRWTAPCSGSQKGEGGSVIAQYDLVTSSGAAKPRQSYAGEYTQSVGENASGTVTIMANGQSVNGTRDGNGISFSGTLPDLGGLTVTFRR